jgi:hypothetical protein
MMEWIGYAMAILHMFITSTLILLIVVSHTVYHELWLKILLFVILFSVFIQHVLFDKCILTVLEKQITTQEQSPFHDILDKLLSKIGLTLEDYERHIVVIEGVASFILGLEVLSLYLR